VAVAVVNEAANKARIGNKRIPALRDRLALENPLARRESFKDLA
jgi:hypothetical protein